MATYARINEYGFLESPYLKVINSVDSNNATGQIASKAVKNSKGNVLVKAGEKNSATTAKKLVSAGIEAVPVKAHVTSEIVYLRCFR
jgi:DNA-directed RNA polymerase subunit beta